VPAAAAGTVSAFAISRFVPAILVLVICSHAPGDYAKAEMLRTNAVEKTAKRTMPSDYIAARG
jgi:hypothetical protein